MSAGFKHGQTIALFMENRPEYVGRLPGPLTRGAISNPAVIHYKDILFESEYNCTVLNIRDARVQSERKVTNQTLDDIGLNEL